MAALQRIRRIRSESFTTINNVVLRDKTISLKAKAVMVTVMGLPESWDFSVEGLVEIVKEGRHAVYAAIEELIEAGYVARAEIRDKGRFVSVEYVFNEQKSASQPYSGFPYTVNPDTEKPYTENQTQYKKQGIKETSNKETPTGRAGIPRNYIPLNTSADLELNTWLNAVAVAMGASDRHAIPKRQKWESVCMTAIREQRDLGKLLSVITTEKQRTKGQEEFFSPDTCLQKLQMNGSAASSKWAHEV